MRFDNTPNVRAEAANSLSLFGKVSASHLVATFCKDEHWLVRTSILAALIELECFAELLEVCEVGLQNDDLAIQKASVDSLGALATSNQAEEALSHLLALAEAPTDHIRIRVAYALKHFDGVAAKAALAKLQQDSNHKVAAAAMEDLLS